MFAVYIVITGDVFKFQKQQAQALLQNELSITSIISCGIKLKQHISDARYKSHYRKMPIYEYGYHDNQSIISTLNFISQQNAQ